MKNDNKLFRMREEHVKYIKELITASEHKLFTKYGEDYITILRNNDNTIDINLKKDIDEYKLIRYISQRADQIINIYKNERKKKDTLYI
jgi:hypothetical protein